jgi:hypothetical protein
MICGQGVAKILFLIPAFLGHVACEGETGTAHTITLQDSGGVSILEAPAEGRDVAAWTVGKSPELLIDEAQGRESFYQVRAGRQFADGGFVIANEGSHELRFYSREGVLKRSVGREGSGPNEFRSFGFLELIADSVWVCDRQNQRCSVLDRAGEFVRLVSLGVFGDGVGVFGDGSILLHRGEPGTMGPGLRRSYRRHVVLHPDGAVSELGRFFRVESYWQAIGKDIVDAGRPFGRQGLTSVRGNEWFYSDGEEYRIEQYDMAGRLRGVYSYPAEPRPVTRRDLEEYLTAFRARVGGPTLREELLRRSPLPERMPAYARLVIDREGNVWAEPHAGAKPQTCWHVYQRRPPLFAEACFPERFRVLDIAGGSVLGVLRDENDVEQIARYRLLR